MEINDIIDYTDNSLKYSLFSNVAFIAFIIYTWLMHSDIVFTFKTLKIVLLFSVIRYLYSQLTTFTKENGKNYFQINNKVGIFVIFISLLVNESVFNNIWTPLVITSVYLYLEIMTAENFTTDVLTSALIGYTVFANYKFLDYI